jgi:hypothetical protein
VSCRLAVRDETPGIDLSGRFRLHLSDRMSRHHYHQSEDSQQSLSRDACTHFKVSLPDRDDLGFWADVRPG